MPFVSPKSNRGPVTMSKDVLLSCIALMNFCVACEGGRTGKKMEVVSEHQLATHVHGICMFAPSL